MNGYGQTFYDPWGHTAGFQNISADPYYASAPSAPSVPSSLPDTPTQLPLTGQPGLPYIPDVELAPELQPTLPYIPDVELAPELQPTLQLPSMEEKQPSGPLEFVGDVIEFAGDVLKTGIDVVWDTTKFILEHLEVGIKWAGDIGGTAAQIKYYEQVGEAAEIRAKAYAQQVARGEMSQEEAIARGMAYGMESMKGLTAGQPVITAGQPVIYETPAAKQLSDYMPLAIAGIAAIFLLKKGKI